MTPPAARPAATAPPQPPPESARRLRLLSYNIQGGAGVTRYREYVTRGWTHVLPSPVKLRNLAHVATLLQDYDIVALQEADGGSLRSNFENQVQHLAERAGFPFWSHQANRRVGRLVEVSNGLLSRHEPREVIDHKLPGAIPGRGVLEVRYGDARDALHVFIAHLALTVRARKQQVDYLVSLIGDLPHVVLMGDLNTTAHSVEMKALFTHTRLQPPTLNLETYPSWQPRRAIDHVLISDALVPTQYEVPLVTVSDHLPIALTIALPDDCKL